MPTGVVFDLLATRPEGLCEFRGHDQQVGGKHDRADRAERQPRRGLGDGKTLRIPETQDAVQVDHQVASLYPLRLRALCGNPNAAQATASAHPRPPVALRRVSDVLVQGP